MSIRPQRFVVRCGMSFLILAICWGAGLRAEGPRLRVATYNVRNYLAMDRRVDGAYRPDYPKPEVEKAAVQDVILRIRPDILALQEMGSEAYLKELAMDLAGRGLPFPYAFVATGADLDRHLALLSRVPWESVRDHPNVISGRLPTGEVRRVKRGLLEAVFRTAGVRWAFYVVHLKSVSEAGAEDAGAARQRNEEATALRNLILRLEGSQPAGPVLVAGDFNDHPRSPALERFSTIGPQALFKAIPAADSRGETWTYWHASSETYSRLDYLLASPALLEWVEGRRAVVDDGPHALAGSDHRMVYLDLRFPPSGRSGERTTAIEDVKSVSADP